MRNVGFQTLNVTEVSLKIIPLEFSSVDPMGPVDELVPKRVDPLNC